MIIKLTLIVIIILGNYALALSDSKYKTENEKYLYWQPGVMIEYDDYQDPPDKSLQEREENLGLTTYSVMTIHSVLDIPSDTTKGLLEHVYFAPVLCKRYSSTLYDDPAGFRLDQLYFSVTELAARMARKSLDSVLYANGGKYGVLNRYFFHYKVEMLEFMMNLTDKIYVDVGLAKKAGSLERWEKIINSLLKKMENYSTKPEDSYRFISSEPILQDYIKAPQVYYDVTDLQKNKELNKRK